MFYFHYSQTQPLKMSLRGTVPQYRVSPIASVSNLPLPPNTTHTHSYRTAISLSQLVPWSIGSISNLSLFFQTDLLVLGLCLASQNSWPLAFSPALLWGFVWIPGLSLSQFISAWCSTSLLGWMVSPQINIVPGTGPCLEIGCWKCK